MKIAINIQIYNKNRGEIMVSKKGQLSIETMIIYGLIALVALATVAALIYFDVLNLGRYLPDNCDLDNTDGLVCEEYVVTDTATQTIKLGIRNEGQKSVDISKVCAHDPEYSTDPVCTSQTVTVTPGNIEEVTVSYSEINDAETVNAEILVEYKITSGTLTQQATGNLRSEVGTTITPAPDADSDGIPDSVDNCPNDANANQEDSDGDGVGDACEP